MITEYAIPGDFVKTSTASLQNKISAAQLNFSNRNVIYILKVDNEAPIKQLQQIQQLQSHREG